MLQQSLGPPEILTSNVSILLVCNPSNAALHAKTHTRKLCFTACIASIVFLCRTAQVEQIKQSKAELQQRDTYIQKLEARLLAQHKAPASVKGGSSSSRGKTVTSSPNCACAKIQSSSLTGCHMLMQVTTAVDMTAESQLCACKKLV